MQAIAHLAELGHEHLAYVGGPSSSWSDRQRRRGIATARAEHDMTLTTLQARPATYAGGKATVDAILASDATAVLAFDDVVAHGVLAGLTEHGVRVPEDMSVIGCDDVFAATTYPVGCENPVLRFWPAVFRVGLCSAPVLADQAVNGLAALEPDVILVGRSRR
jgi:DNA-binding LacI/PurR family transcriptional regulator